MRSESEAAKGSQEAAARRPLIELDRTSRRQAAGRFGRGALVALMLLCAGSLLLGFVNKDRCTGPSYDEWGRSQPNYQLRSYRDVCYSDVQYLWLGRDIDQHVFPYVHGGIDAAGKLFGGSIEYPVLTGMLMWAGAFFASNDHQFLVDTAILLAPFGLGTMWLLIRLARWRALVWAAGPPLVLYAFHNWDLAVVATSVAAIYVLYFGWGTTGARRPLRQRATAAAVLLGVGFCFKLYPAIFVVPLMCYVATGGAGGRQLAGLPAGRRYDVMGAIRVLLAAGGTIFLVNLPFMVSGFKGWRAAFAFQEVRAVDITTNSIWFWGFRPISNPDDHRFQQAVNVLSPMLIIASFLLACYLGWRRYRRTGTYPFVNVSAAMLCGFLLFHKVDSPQYTLWLVPMFALLLVRWQWIVAFYVCDMALGIGIFRYFYAIDYGKPYGIYDGFASQAVTVGVWGRAVLLGVLFFAFLKADSIVDEKTEFITVRDQKWVAQVC